MRGRNKKRDENKASAELHSDRGILILTTLYSQWYWLEEEKVVVRYSAGGLTELERGMMFTGQNDLLSATAVATNREYRRINKERNAQAAKVVDVDKYVGSSEGTATFSKSESSHETYGVEI